MKPDIVARLVIDLHRTGDYYLSYREPDGNGALVPVPLTGAQYAELLADCAALDWDDARDSAPAPERPLERRFALVPLPVDTKED